MALNDAGSLAEIVNKLDSLANNVEHRLGGLSPEQLNWKPSPDQWSIAQCLEHLIITNRPYIPTFEQILSNEKQTTAWERLPFLPGFVGRFLIKALDPDSKRKVKAPKIFQPSLSKIDSKIIPEFISQEKRIATLMKALADRDLEKQRVTSPVSRVVTYSLFDAFRIILVHEQRHFAQAERVMASKDFPLHS